MEMKEQFHLIYNLFKKFKIMNNSQLKEIKNFINLNYLIMQKFELVQ